MSSGQQSEQGVNEFGSSPPSQTSSNFIGDELNRQFPLLKDLSISQLRELIDSSELMDSFVESSASVGLLREHTERVIETAEKLAKENLILEPELTKLLTEITEKFRQLCELRLKYDNANVEYQKLCEKYNPKSIQESLLQSVAAVDEESEKIAEAFLSGETDLESFVQDYISHRAMSHSHKIRYEKLTKQLEKLKQAEIAVSRENQIELLTSSGDMVALVRHSLSEAFALAFDSVHSDLYVSDTSQKNVSIFRIHVNKDGKSGLLQPVVQSSTKYIEGLAYDPVTSAVFWTTGNEKTIMRAHLNENKTELAVGTVLHQFDKEILYGIAVDSCKGKLYWTNCNVGSPSIERSDLDGKRREVIISSRLFRPKAVAISQADRLMYWVDEKTGYLFTIERCALDGTNRQIIVYSEHQQPLSLAVTGSRLYWTDDMHSSVWSVLHSSPELVMPMVETRHIKMYSDHKATLGGIVTAYQDRQLDEKTCRNMIDLRSKVSSVVNVTGGTCLHGLATQTGGCLCAAGYTGIHCETSVCHNFCLNGGECFLDNSAAPICKCPRPFSGVRCNEDLCRGKCLNGGYCSISPSGTSSVCQCTDSFVGDRCQLPSKVCDHYCTKVATSRSYDRAAARLCRCTIYAAVETPLVQPKNMTAKEITVGADKPWLEWSLGATCVVLLSICLVMIVIIFKLKGRPRLIRRYQVNPGTLKKPAEGDCEIAIENCCNMNICDTPCYEPEFRTPGRNAKSKKEEKRGLLPNMEVQPPDSSSNDLF